jgi:hypothetical protein
MQEIVVDADVDTIYPQTMLYLGNIKLSVLFRKYWKTELYSLQKIWGDV